MRRLTRKSLTVGAVGGLLFVGASTAQAGWLFVLAAGVLGLVAGSLMVRHDLDDLGLAREISRRARVGDEVKVELVLSTRGRSAAPGIRVTDGFGAYRDAVIGYAEEVAPAAPARLRASSVAATRGVFTSGPATIESRAPFGLSRTRRVMDVDSALTVVPSWVDLRSFPILEPASYPFENLHHRARTGAGEEYMGVREYRPGDPQRNVHWRSSARAGRLVVKEFQEEATTRVTVALAGPDVGEPPDSAFEALVSAAASIGRYALVTGHPVEIVSAAPEGGVNRGRELDPDGVLEHLASVTAVEMSPEDLASAAVSDAGRRATVVLCVPLLADTGASLHDAVSIVQRAGCRCIAVVARAASWSGLLHADEQAALRELRRITPTRVLEASRGLAECLAA